MKKNGFPLTIIVLAILFFGAILLIFKEKGLFASKIPEQKLDTSVVEGDGGALLQFSYPDNQLQTSSPQCEPGKNSQGFNAMDCEYVLLKTKPVILFVSYYKDPRFSQIETYKKYLLQNNLVKDVKDVNLGEASSINAILYIPPNPDKERKGATQEYALMKNGSLFLIDLKDNTDVSNQLLNQIVSTLTFTK